MATLARDTAPARDRFFLYSAILMAAINVLGFSLQVGMGRSSFAAPPLVHAHAVVFMGWVAIYLTQNVLVASRNLRLHRRLGWVAAGWMVAMVVLGIAATVAMVRRGGVPFFFTPAYFIVMNPLSVLAFAGFGFAAIRLRRRTDWHRRLHYCGMAVLMGPAIGRLLPVPFLIPWAGLAVFGALILFPLAGAIADRRRLGRVHPAYVWGIAAILGLQVVIEVGGRGALGTALVAAVTTGSPGAAIPALEYPAPPPLS